jgi:hypothetical protein
MANLNQTRLSFSVVESIIKQSTPHRSPILSDSYTHIWTIPVFFSNTKSISSHIIHLPRLLFLLWTVTWALLDFCMHNICNWQREKKINVTLIYVPYIFSTTYLSFQINQTKKQGIRMKSKTKSYPIKNATVCYQHIINKTYLV